MCQQVTPAFDLSQKGIVYLGSAALSSGGFGILIEGALENRLFGENVVYIVPMRLVIKVSEHEEAPSGGFVGFIGLGTAVIDGKLFKISEDREGQLGTPGIAA
jgi:hypothetical protein